MESDPEQAIERDIGELDERVERLESSIDKAKELSTGEAEPSEDPEDES
jgi:sugar-specific transcriptional regulator TrmB